MKNVLFINCVIEKISVPLIDVKTFDPDNVPKIGDLITEREDGFLSKILRKKKKYWWWIVVNEKPLKPYVDYFQMFVDGLEQEAKKQQMTDRAELRNEQGMSFFLILIDLIIGKNLEY